MSLPNPTRKSPLICYVTDRRAFSVSTAAQEEQCAGLVAKIAAAAAAGVDWIQIREKDLDGSSLAELARAVLAQVNPQCRILINDRLDVAYAAGAAGVHLGERSLSVADAKSFIRKKNNGQAFSIGASVHSLEAAQRAESDGADYLIFGPVFATPSKLSFGAPQGLERLEAICSTIKIPVLAIGGLPWKLRRNVTRGAPPESRESVFFRNSSSRKASSLNCGSSKALNELSSFFYQSPQQSNLACMVNIVKTDSVNHATLFFVSGFLKAREMDCRVRDVPFPVDPRSALHAASVAFPFSGRAKKLRAFQDE